MRPATMDEELARVPAIDERPAIEPNEIRICKNQPKCTNIVPRSKNPGRERLFCSRRCAVNYHSRQYHSRELGTGKLIQDTERGPKVNRRMPQTAAQAEKRYKEHHQSCPLNGGAPCPGARDAYGLERLCILKAVYLEDWNQLRAQEKGLEPYVRYLTTEDGYWLPEEETIRIRGPWR